uniref:COMM domain-containing protein n=1 Tax=Romanomermis culicivorax TaxID=13658 RepID=A0A915LBJ5_ROMCU
MSNPEESFVEFENFDDVSFGKLLNKIIQRSVGSNQQSSMLNFESLFTSEEIKALVDNLNSDVPNILRLGRRCCDIIRQMIYHYPSIDPGIEKLSISESKGAILKRLSETGDFNTMINIFKNISTSENAVKNLNYLLNVELSSESRRLVNKPTAVLQFEMENGIKKNLELDHEQLYDFYDKLEIIQQQLDSFAS